MNTSRLTDTKDEAAAIAALLVFAAQRCADINCFKSADLVEAAIYQIALETGVDTDDAAVMRRFFLNDPSIASRTRQ